VNARASARNEPEAQRHLRASDARQTRPVAKRASSRSSSRATLPRRRSAPSLVILIDRVAANGRRTDRTAGLRRSAPRARIARLTYTRAAVLEKPASLRVAFEVAGVNGERIVAAASKCQRARRYAGSRSPPGNGDARARSASRPSSPESTNATRRTLVFPERPQRVYVSLAYTPLVVHYDADRCSISAGGRSAATRSIRNEARC